MSTNWPDLLLSSIPHAIGATAAAAVIAMAVAAWQGVQKRRKGLGRDFVPLLKVLISVSATILSVIIANYFLLPATCLLVGVTVYIVLTVILFWPKRHPDTAQALAARHAIEISNKLFPPEACDSSQFKVVEGGVGQKRVEGGSIYKVSDFKIRALALPFGGRSLRIVFTGPVALDASEFRFERSGSISDQPAGTSALENRETIIISFGGREETSPSTYLIARIASTQILRITSLAWYQDD